MLFLRRFKFADAVCRSQTQHRRNIYTFWLISLAAGVVYNGAEGPEGTGSLPPYHTRASVLHTFNILNMTTLLVLLPNTTPKYSSKQSSISFISVILDMLSSVNWAYLMFIVKKKNYYLYLRNVCTFWKKMFKCYVMVCYFQCYIQTNKEYVNEYVFL